MDKLCLIHIPKSAGVSFLHLLRDQVYGEERTHEHFNAYKTEPSIYELNKKDLVVGHVDFADLQYDMPGFKFATILRHPVNRAISWYKYSKLISDDGINKVNGSMSLEDLCTSNHRLNKMYVHNTMTWMLGDHLELERRTVEPEKALLQAKAKILNMDDVLFFNTLIPCMERVCNKYKFDVNIHKMPWVNPTIWVDANITDEAVARLKECNKLDIELYNYALNSRKWRGE